MTSSTRPFLPFTPSGVETELKAIRVKEHLGYQAHEAVVPEECLDRVPATLVDPLIIEKALPAAAKILFETNQDDWSAIGLGRSPDDGREMILLNPKHHPHRRRATLMEEIVHVVLGHPRTILQRTPDSKWERRYNETLEDEAYNVGAACLVPYRELFFAVKQEGSSAATIASHYGLSEAHIRFRIRRSGLARVYDKQQRLRYRGRS